MSFISDVKNPQLEKLSFLYVPELQGLSLIKKTQEKGTSVYLGRKWGFCNSGVLDITKTSNIWHLVLDIEYIPATLQIMLCQMVYGVFRRL